MLFSAEDSLIFRSWLALILVAALALVLIWRIQDEEALMHQQFGFEWEAYSQRSWRLIPFVYWIMNKKNYVWATLAENALCAAPNKKFLLTIRKFLLHYYPSLSNNYILKKSANSGVDRAKRRRNWQRKLSCDTANPHLRQLLFLGIDNCLAGHHCTDGIILTRNLLWHNQIECS